MAEQTETVTLRLPSGEEVDVVVPAGMSDQQVHDLMQMRHPELTGPPSAKAAGPAPMERDNPVTIGNLASQPSKLSWAEHPFLRPFDEIGQGMAQGLQAIGHPLDTLASAGQYLKDSWSDPNFSRSQPSPTANAPLLTQLGDMADNVAQSWGQAATLGPAAKAGGRAIEVMLPEKPTLAPLGSPQNPGPHMKIPLRVPKSVLDAERAAANPSAPPAPLGSPENPGPMAKLPMRVPREVLAEEAEARAKMTGGETYRDATTNRMNIPPYAGEEVAPPNAVAPRIGGRRMGPPLRPLVGSPEEWQAYDQQKAILKPEASDAGLYSAARGAVSRVPDYQIRIGKALRQFGEPVNLMEQESAPRPRPKAENE